MADQPLAPLTFPCSPPIPTHLLNLLVVAAPAWPNPISPDHFLHPYLTNSSASTPPSDLCKKKVYSYLLEVHSISQGEGSYLRKREETGTKKNIKERRQNPFGKEKMKPPPFKKKAWTHVQAFDHGSPTFTELVIVTITAHARFKSQNTVHTSLVHPHAHP